VTEERKEGKGVGRRGKRGWKEGSRSGGNVLRKSGRKEGGRDRGRGKREKEGGEGA